MRKVTQWDAGFQGKRNTEEIMKDLFFKHTKFISSLMLNSINS